MLFMLWASNNKPAYNPFINTRICFQQAIPFTNQFVHKQKTLKRLASLPRRGRPSTFTPRSAHVMHTEKTKQECTDSMTALLEAEAG